MMGKSDSPRADRTPAKPAAGPWTENAEQEGVPGRLEDELRFPALREGLIDGPAHLAR